MFGIPSEIQESKAELSVRAGDIYRLGELRDYELVFPKRGFLGCPPSPSGKPDVLTPSKEEHFDKRLIRVSVKEALAKGDASEIVLQIDGIIESADTLRFQEIYSAHVNITVDGMAILLHSTFCDEKILSHPTEMVSHGVPFPITCGRPPALGFSHGESEACMLSGDILGTRYEEKAVQDASGQIEIEATLFEAPREALNVTPAKQVRLNAADTAALLKKGGKARVLFREKQKWARRDDWLWTSMERYDANGHIQLRCTQIEPLKGDRPK